MTPEVMRSMFYAMAPFLQSSVFEDDQLEFKTAKGSFHATNEGDTVFMTCDFVPQLQEVRLPTDSFLYLADVIQALLLQAHDGVIRIPSGERFPEDFMNEALSGK